MKPNEMTSFAKLLAGVSLLYGKTLPACLLDIYWQTLQTFELQAIEMALQAHVQNPDGGQYMPKPADIMRYLTGSLQSQARRAWSQVLDKIQSVGSYTSVVFEDPFIHAVIADMGGWIQLCSLTQATLAYRAQEFEKRYLDYQWHPPLDCPKKLIGRMERQNHQENTVRSFR